MERAAGIEPVYRPWQGRGLTIVLRPHMCGRSCKNRTHVKGFGDQGTATIPNSYLLDTLIAFSKPKFDAFNIAVSI